MVLHSLSKRAHINSWVIEHYRGRDIFIQLRWFGFKGAPFNIILLLYCQQRGECTVQKMASACSSPVAWHQAQHKTWRQIDQWKDESILVRVAVLSVNSFSVVRRELALGLYSNWQIGEQHHKLPVRFETGNLAAWLFPLQKQILQSFPRACLALVLAWVGTFSLWKCGMNYPLLTEMDVIEWFVAVY